MQIDKIKADFLTPTKALLEIELSRTPMMMTYEQALSLFRNMVNQKHPPQMGAAQNRVRRNINETNTGRGGREKVEVAMVVVDVARVEVDVGIIALDPTVV